MVIFHSFLYVYQRVKLTNHCWVAQLLTPPGVPFAPHPMTHGTGLQRFWSLCPVASDRNCAGGGGLQRVEMFFFSASVVPRNTSG